MGTGTTCADEHSGSCPQCAAPVEHLVYASSSSVYGGNKKVPFSTDDRVDNPVSLYAATKKSNELFAHCYNYGNCRRDFTYVDDMLECGSRKEIQAVSRLTKT